MARNMYGATSADFTLTSGGRVVPGAELTLWTARTGGTQITDLLDADSVACTTVTSAADGSVVYYGPNNDKTVHWADSGQGSRVAIRPTDITGDPPVMSIGTVGTGTAAASLTGTSEAPVLNLTLPSAGANGVDTAAIQSKAVTAAKIADDTITAAQIAANAVGSSELADSAVDTAVIADGAVTSAKIADGTITATDVAAGTFAAFGTVGQLRFDPFAMLPFCGYDMARYFQHWLDIGAKADPEKLPRIFYVNWFRKDEDGKFIWPGFGENSRVLEWVFRRCDGESAAEETPIGLVPAAGELNTEGLEISDEELAELTAVDEEKLKAELPQVEEHLARFGDRLPAPLRDHLELLKSKLD